MTSKEEQEVGSGEEREDIAGAGAESDEEASADDDSGFDGSSKKNKRGKKRKQGKDGKEKEIKRRKAESDMSKSEGSGEDEDSTPKLWKWGRKSNKGSAMEESAPSKEESPGAEAMPTVLRVSSGVLSDLHPFFSLRFVSSGG